MALKAEREPQPIVRFRHARGELDRAPVGADRLVELLAALQDHAEKVVRFRIRRRLRGRLRKASLGLIGTVRSQQSHALGDQLRRGLRLGGRGPGLRRTGIGRRRAKRAYEASTVEPVRAGT